MTTPLTFVNSATHEHNTKFLHSLVMAKTPVVILFFDRNLQIVAYSSMDAKQYILPGEKHDWLVTLTLTEQVFSSAQVYESRRQDLAGTLFKRSSYPPEMVRQEDFLKNVNSYSKVLAEVLKALR